MFAKIRSMFIKRGPEFQFLEKENKNYNVWKDKIKIPVFAMIRSELECLLKECTTFLMFGRIRSQFQSLDE